MAATKQSIVTLNGNEPSTTPLPRTALTIHAPKPDIATRLEAVNPEHDDDPPKSDSDSNTNPSIPISPPLTSSRPAPQSPAISRRTSQATRPSRRTSRISDASSSSRHVHRASLTTTPFSPTSPPFPFPSASTSASASTPTPTPTPKSTPKSNPPHGETTPTRRVLTIKIRDFGFQSGDDKHRGLGDYVPKSNRPRHLLRLLNAHLGLGSDSSTSTSDDDDDDDDSDDSQDPEEEEEEDDAFDGFKFGFGKLSWSFGKRASTTTTGVAPQDPTTTRGGFPSKSDMERNFVDSSSSSSSDEEYFESYHPPEDEEDDEEEEEEEGEEGESSLLPGLYRALYAFTSEGPTEMSLTKGQLVDVIGRGGGEGWAVVRCQQEEGRKHALVPESYLEVVRVDE